MSSPFSAMLDSLIRHRGVLGSLVVDERDGIIVDSILSVGLRGSVVAALAGSLYRKARLSAAAAGLGDATFLQLEAEKGRICAVGRNDLVIVVVAEPRTNIGLLRMEMLRAVETLG